MNLALAGVTGGCISQHVRGDEWIILGNLCAQRILELDGIDILSPY